MSDREDLLAKALADYIDLQARGEVVDVPAFCGKYPGIKPQLQAHLETLSEIDAMVDPPEAIRSRSSEDLPPTLSGLRILSEIGSGGMGRVLLAFDERLGRQVAIKTLSSRYRDNEHVRRRFHEEARAMARLSHPHVVRIYNLGSPEETPHFVMEHVEGAPLTEAAKALTLSQRVELMHKVALAADFLHQHQVIHRDLKPGNILVGPDLEPKLLDFGLALQVDRDTEKLTWAGEILGTPHYFSPEQARADSPLDARSDVFSLGVVLYELLTSVAPFKGETLQELLESVCKRDPVLPRRINPAIPGELQNICLKALEKNPGDRYASAREMAQDLERFLAGEPVLAAPGAYARLMAGKIEQHLRELEGWKQDQILSEAECDALRKRYERLVEREDAWIMEVRRLSVAQVSLYLGAWILVVGAALIVLFRYAGLSGAPAVLVAVAAAAPTAYIGIRCWRQGRLRIAVAYLLAFCLLLPIAFMVALSEDGLFSGASQHNEKLEFLARFPSFKRTTNAQLWWSIFLSLPAYYWLRRFTKSSVFSLVFAVMGALLSLVTLLRMGMLEWLDTDPGRVYFRLLPFALLFLAAGVLIEHLKHSADSRYFYPVAVVFTLVALSGVASFHEPYAQWLQSFAPWTRGQIEYLFILNAGIYLILQTICERFPSAQMRWVAKSFRFVIPGHVLTSMLLLGLAASERWQEAPARADLRLEARTFEILLPCAACAFVFGSILKQMKNFFAMGMLFLAIGIVRLQQDLFKDRSGWPLTLLLAGLLLMFTAANYASIRMTISHWTRRFH